MPKIKHLTVTPERRDLYLRSLARHGSKRQAAVEASRHLDGFDPSNPNRASGTFANLERRDPTFAAEVREAIAVAIGAAEEMLSVRMNTPDRRPIIDKNGNIVAE